MIQDSQHPINSANLGTGVFRSPSVVNTGIAWFCVGAAIVLLIGVSLATNKHLSNVEYEISFAASLFFSIFGYGFARSRIVITESAIISTWIFSSKKIPLNDLEDAVIALPKSRQGVSTAMGNLGGLGIGGADDIDSFIFGALTGFLSKLIGWAILPTSSEHHVLHLIKEFGGSIKIPPISMRTKRGSSVDQTTLIAVKSAIAQYGARSSKPRYPKTPAGKWTPEPLPTFHPNPTHPNPLGGQSQY